MVSAAADRAGCRREGCHVGAWYAEGVRARVSHRDARQGDGGALAENRAPKPVADAVSALVNLGYGQPQAAAAIAAAARNAGEGADTATLIRQGLKELSR